MPLAGRALRHVVDLVLAANDVAPTSNLTNSESRIHGKLGMMEKTEEVPLDSSEQVTTSKKNRLLALGYMGDYHCYLNVSREEAVRRYKEHYRRMHERDLQGVAEGRFPADPSSRSFANLTSTL
jgi:hypothetical protein